MSRCKIEKVQCSHFLFFEDSKIYLSFQMPPSRKIDKVFLPTDAACVYESGRLISQMDSESSTAFIIVRYDLVV